MTIHLRSLYERRLSRIYLGIGNAEELNSKGSMLEFIGHKER